MRCFIFLVLFILGIASVATAGRPAPLPRDQWTPQARLWLSRAFISEAGFESEADHVAIAYVLARRWERLSKRYPHLRFLDVVRAYCSGLAPSLQEPTRRQKWVRALTPDGLQPLGWPKRASWKNHRPLWRAALQRAESWRRGRLPDPCRGRAWHFGGEMDLPRAERLQLVPIECEEPTLNIFFGLKDKEAEYVRQERATEPGS